MKTVYRDSALWARLPACSERSSLGVLRPEIHSGTQSKPLLRSPERLVEVVYRPAATVSRLSVPVVAHVTRRYSRI